MDDKLSLKGRGQGHMTHLLFRRPLFLEWLKRESRGFSEVAEPFVSH